MFIKKNPIKDEFPSGTWRGVRPANLDLNHNQFYLFHSDLSEQARLVTTLSKLNVYLNKFLEKHR